jgi:ATP-dependent DNA helicase PIF1
MKRTYQQSVKDDNSSREEIISRVAKNLDSSQLEIVKNCFRIPSKNIFITGPGGSGKSFLINAIKDISAYLRTCLYVTASTGCAAVNIEGTTLHSFIGIGLGNGTMDYSKTMRNDVKSRLISTEMLIIDEISMISPEYLTKADATLKKVRSSKSFFGGIQLILVGDFFQLPPVSREQEKKYIFQDEIWKNINASCYVLKKNYRQLEDEIYSSFLSKMRCGDLELSDYNEIYSKIKSKPIPEDNDIPHLFAKRESAEIYNTKKLSSIPGEEYIYETHGSNFEKLENFVNVPKKLTLKTGAGVLLCKNIDISRGLCNGSNGKIVGFESGITDSKPYPLVKFMDTGETLKITEQKWELTNEKGATIATLYQIPLILSYGITIHKSQGMTLSRVVINPGFFAPGQAYVAFSRVKNIDGLYIQNDIPYNSIKTDPNVVQFYKKNNLL